MEKRKIVMVDDEQNVLSAMKRILHRNDYELIIFDNALEALDFLRNVKGDIDLLISDNKMPFMSGTDLLIAVKNDFPNIIKIMLTGNSDIKDAQKAINDGNVYKFLTKPCNAHDLRLTVSHALANKDLWEEKQRLVKTIKQQNEALETLEKEHPGILQIDRDNDGSVVLDIKQEESYEDFIKKYYSELD